MTIEPLLIVAPGLLVNLGVALDIGRDQVAKGPPLGRFLPLLQGVLPTVSSAQCVSVGRAVLARSLLVGIDRAARDFLDLVR